MLFLKKWFLSQTENDVQKSKTKKIHLRWRWRDVGAPAVQKAFGSGIR